MKSRTEQEQARVQWMANEAQRLMDARAATHRPANPLTIHTNQIHDPRSVQVDPQKVASDRAANVLIAALARRDQGNER